MIRRLLFLALTKEKVKINKDSVERIKMVEERNNMQESRTYCIATYLDVT